MSTTNLSFEDAIAALNEGLNIRLPEWTGYWFKDPKDGGIKVQSRTGEILNTPHYSTYAHRNNWEIVIRGLGFDFAILALKSGKKVTRLGWNGKNMYLWLLPETTVPREWIKDPMLLDAFGDNQELRCLGSIRMKTADGSVLTGWLASQSDMLAEDWMIFQ